MLYPPDLSAKARNLIEAEQLRAMQEFEDNQAKEPPSNWKGTATEWDKWEFERYILRIWLAFADQACELARLGEWTVEHVRWQTDEFLRILTVDANYELGRDRYGRKFPEMTGTSGVLLPDVKKKFRMSDECRKFEADLLLIAEGMARPEAGIESRPKDKIGVRPFPNRAVWLREQLRKRSWNKHDLSGHGGPDHKTVQKVLDGYAVREDVLPKVADALSKKNGSVAVLEIPVD
jgi:hypothetical protein